MVSLARLPSSLLADCRYEKRAIAKADVSQLLAKLVAPFLMPLPVIAVATMRPHGAPRRGPRRYCARFQALAAHSGELLWTQELQDSVKSCAISPKHTSIVLGMAGLAQACCRDIGSGDIVWNFDLGCRGQPSVAFTPDGSFVSVFISRGDTPADYHQYAWKLESNSGNLLSEVDLVSAVGGRWEFEAGDYCIATCGGRNIRIMDADFVQALLEVELSLGTFAETVKFAPGEQCAVVGYQSPSYPKGRIRKIAVQSGETSWDIGLSNGGITSVPYSKSCHSIAVGSVRDGQVWRVDADSGDIILNKIIVARGTPEHRGTPTDRIVVAYSPSDTSIIVGPEDGRVLSLDSESGEILWQVSRGLATCIASELDWTCDWLVLSPLSEFIRNNRMHLS